MADERYLYSDGWSDDALIGAFTRGLRDGSAAASTDSPTFVGYQRMLTLAWDLSRGQPHLTQLAEQEEYFIAWVHGYIGRCDEIEGAPEC